MENANNYDNSDRSSDNDGSLELSCASYSFDEDAFPSNSPCKNYEVEPFRFEPYESNPPCEESDSDDAESEKANRLLNNDWCKCGNCFIMPTARECVCCHELSKIKSIFEEDDENITCITAHPGFPPACLNKYVLQIAYYQYKQQYGEAIEDSSEKYRYTAYRQLARWAWGYLGKKIRVVIPACAVNCIRNSFPHN